MRIGVHRNNGMEEAVNADVLKRTKSDAAAAGQHA